MMSHDLLVQMAYSLYYCAFHKVANSKVQKPPEFLAAVNHNDNHKKQTLKQRNTKNGSKSTSHKSHEPVKVKFCFPRSQLR